MTRPSETNVFLRLYNDQKKQTIDATDTSQKQSQLEPDEITSRFLERQAYYDMLKKVIE